MAFTVDRNLNKTFILYITIC